MWKPDNYPSTGLSHSFLNWLSQSWTEVRGKKIKRNKKKSQPESCLQTAGCKLWNKKAYFLFYDVHANPNAFTAWIRFHWDTGMNVWTCNRLCVCRCAHYTSPRGSGPHTLVRHGEGSGCCRSAVGPGSRCRSWCCRETRRSRVSRLRFYGDKQSCISLSYNFSHRQKDNNEIRARGKSRYSHELITPWGMTWERAYNMA